MRASRRRATSTHHCIVVPSLRRPGARWLLPGWLAITVGPVIVSWRPLDAAELAHELEHVGQWRRHGLRFIPRYLGAARSAVRRGGDRYLDNPFEVAARRAADRSKVASARAVPAVPADRRATTTAL